MPPLAPDKAAQYAALFEESGAQNGLLHGKPIISSSSTALLMHRQEEPPNKFSIELNCPTTF